MLYSCHKVRTILFIIYIIFIKNRNCIEKSDTKKKIVDKRLTIPNVKEHLEILYESRSQQMFAKYASMVYSELVQSGEEEYANYLKKTYFDDNNNWFDNYF